MASKCISKLARLRPPSVSPKSLDHGLQCASPNSHDYRLQVRMIKASKYISKLTRSRPPSVSPKSLNHGLQVYLQSGSITACTFARSWPPIASTNSLDHDLGVNLSVHSIMASKCNSKYARLPPASASPN